MIKNLSKFLSFFIILSINTSFVEGVKKVFTIKKEYGQKFAKELELILKLPAFKDCKKYFKIEGYKGEVCLNKDYILDRSRFIDCFVSLVSISDALKYDAKMFCLKLIDDLISYVNDENNKIFDVGDENLKCYANSFKHLDGYEDFKSINWLIWDIDNFIANYDATHIRKKVFRRFKKTKTNLRGYL